MRERMSFLVFLDWFEMLVLGALLGEREKRLSSSCRACT